MTKEKFLRAIVGDPPLIVEHNENIELESQLTEIKAVLKAQKELVAQIVAELDAKGKDLSRRYETVTLQSTLLSSLPPQIKGLNQTLADLMKQNQSTHVNEEMNPGMALPLPATLDLLEEKRANLDEINAQLKALQQAIPRQTRMMEMEERELRKLEAERERAVGAAREAAERRRGGDGASDLEMKGRWLRSAESGLKLMMEVEA